MTPLDLRADQDNADTAAARELIARYRAEITADRADRVLGIVLAAVSGAALTCAAWSFLLPVVEGCR